MGKHAADRFRRLEVPCQRNVQTTGAGRRKKKALGLMIRRKQLVQLLLLLMAQAKADKIS